MPYVGGKKYPYTKEGRAAAAKAKAKPKTAKKAVPSNKQARPDPSKPKKAVPSNKQRMTPALKKLLKKKK